MYYLAVSLLPTGEPELYCTSFVRGSTSDDGSVEVELQNGTFRFLEQSYTSVFVSCNCLVKYLCSIYRFIALSSQVHNNGHVSLIGSFSDVRVASFRGRRLPSIPPILAPFLSDANTSDAGLVLYRETQDPVLISRYADEVNTAFPNQTAFTPVYLFIVTWLQVAPFDMDGVS